MLELIALRAAFGQEEVNHGAVRYRVDIDGLVRVPREAVPFLVGTGGFAVATTNEGSVERGMIRLHHCEAAGCSYGGRHYPNDANGDVIVPAAAAMALLAHGFESVTNEATLTPNSAERSSNARSLEE